MEPLIHTGEETKIIWRMTGTGELQVYAIHQDGTRIAPTGLRTHAPTGVPGPGEEEWGVFFRFTKSGCWQIHAERGDAKGDVWFIAAPAR